MSEKIEKTLRKLAAATQTGKTTDPSPVSRPTGPRQHRLPGDPECPICGGIGYLRLDLPVDHPDFGRLEVCSCRNSQISQEIHRKLFALSNLEKLQHLTLDNFLPRGRVGLRPAQADSLERAHNQARIFSGSLKGWLLLQGGYGCGKTHLAAAIANFAVGVGVPTIFLTVPDLLDTLRFAYDDPEATFQARFEEIRTAPLLVMDDFGTQSATPWAQEKLFQILNYRYINHLPLVVTTNLLLEQIEGRIRSRLTDPELVTRVAILAPDYRDPMSESSEGELASLDLIRKFTFANFDLRKNEGLPTDDVLSLQRAFDSARLFAERPRGWLVLSGPYGCGKTHLAAAIANFRDDLGQPLSFMKVPDLMDHLRASFAPTSAVSFDRRFEEVSTAPLLILDDLGTQASSPWVREKLFQLFDHRYLAELPTVITTADYKEEMDPRLLSRMQDARLCTRCAITVPAYRGAPAKPARKRSR
jgi:DNA replication protein DnaC